MLVFILAALPVPVDLDTLLIERARELSGRLVVTSVTSQLPSYTLRGRTIIGPYMRDDGVERGAVLRGNRLDIRDGERVKVVGVLKVIDWPACFVWPVLVPGWVDLRVEE